MTPSNRTIEIQKYKSIVVLTGAGISVASGLPTYRGTGGIWNDPETAKFSTASAFQADPAGCWQFWQVMKDRAVHASPNPAHIALADLEVKIANGRTLTLITQNVDELHLRAGSSNIVELHGSLFRSKCSNSECNLPIRRDNASHAEAVPICPQCGSPLRPDIVLFDEPLPPDAEQSAKRALRACDLFIAVGTSGTVSPASRFVEWAKYMDAYTVLINSETASSSSFDQQLIGKAEDILPSLFK
jgi:NAD-dependent deacetylase